MTPIDPARIAKVYEERYGEAYSRAVPDTLEALFDRHHDPDAFQLSTARLFEVVRDLLAAPGTVLEGNKQVNGEPVVQAGPLTVRGDFFYDTHLLVLGDLSVEGELVSGFPHKILIVAGNIRCRAMHCVRSYVLVTGDIVADEAVLFQTYGSSMCLGEIRTKIYAADDSWTNRDVEDEPTDENVVAEEIVPEEEVEELDLESLRERAR